jgi:formate dehydrogenase accessory protein FdhD
MGVIAAGSSQGQELVAIEQAIAIVVNGIAHAVMMATPEDLEDFAMGFALTEGLIDDAGDLLDVEFESAERGISLYLRVPERQAIRLRAQRRSLAGCTGCGLCGIERLDAIPQAAFAVHPPLLSPPVQATLNLAMQTLSEAQRWNAQCGGLHAAGLFDTQGQRLIVREDVGRHNALDKVLGAAAWSKRRGRWTASEAFVAVSSRASYEMVYKTASAGFGLLASVSAPTSLAIDTATRCGLQLYGFVREGRATRYA